MTLFGLLLHVLLWLWGFKKGIVVSVTIILSRALDPSCNASVLKTNYPWEWLKPCCWYNRRLKLPGQKKNRIWIYPGTGGEETVLQIISNNIKPLWQTAITEQWWLQVFWILIAWSCMQKDKHFITIIASIF